MTVHDFATTQNEDAADWWQLVYRRAFVAYERHEVVTDRRLQKAGIDHKVYLSGGGIILVDVKTRSRWFPDVIIEVWSDRSRHVPGWARKPLQCHYVAYAFPTCEIAYLLPFHLLQRAYERHKHEWAGLANTEEERLPGR